jgi:hypothetical protein
MDEVLDDRAVFQVLEKASDELFENYSGVVFLELTIGNHLVELGLGDELDGRVGVTAWVGIGLLGSGCRTEHND